MQTIVAMNVNMNCKHWMIYIIVDLKETLASILYADYYSYIDMDCKCGQCIYRIEKSTVSAYANFMVDCFLKNYMKMEKLVV